MQLETLFTAEIFANFWRTVLLDVLKKKLFSKLQKATAPTPEKLFEKAVKNANIDLKPEISRKIIESIRTNKALHGRLQDFQYKGMLIHTEFLAQLFKDIVGDRYIAYVIASDVFVEFRKLVAQQPDMKNEILQMYGEQLLAHMDEHDVSMHEEHRNQSTELEELKEMIRYLPSITSPKSLFDRYLHQLSIECDRLPLGPIDPKFYDAKSKESIHLVNIYTQLDSMDVRDIHDEVKLNIFFRDIEKEKRIPILELANNEDHLLILGNPGSGKTTFVNYVGYVLAKSLISEESEKWKSQLTPWDHRDIIPVRIVLRELVETLEERDSTFVCILNFLETYLKKKKVAPFWNELEEWICSPKPEKQLLFFFDGLDEVSEAWREDIVKSINDFVDHYSSHRYVVTCRPYAYIGQSYSLGGFHQITIAPLSTVQIDYFIKVWYDELARLNRIKRESVEGRIENLKAEIRNREIRPLVDRPLLLTLTALLHSEEGKLPRIPVDLYDRTVDLLLDRWQRKDDDQPGLIETLNIPGVEMSDVKSCLFEVAYKAHAGRTDQGLTADIGEAELKSDIEEIMGIEPNAAKRFIDYIRDRAGLLIRHKHKAFTFPHRLFQEFLAACYLVQKSDFSQYAAELVKKDPTFWREVFLLSVARAARRDQLPAALDAVQRLCAQDWRDVTEPNASDYARAILAGLALFKIGTFIVKRDEIGQRIYKAITGLDRWLHKTITDDKVLEPKIRVQAGQVLSKLGDPRPGIGVAFKGDIPDILWCKIPGGIFQMGEWKEAHAVSLDTFYMSRYAVTNAQFQVFIDQGGYSNKDYWKEAETAKVWKNSAVKGGNEKSWRAHPYDYGEPFNLANHPVVGVMWYEALAFCRWLNDRFEKMNAISLWENGEIKNIDIPSGMKIFLPSEAEWECAARGGHQAKYPWGTDSINENNANYNDTKIETTSAVGCFPYGENDFGLLDMSGNVWEWTRSHYKAYPYKAKDREDLSARSSVTRVLRGGSFSDDAELCRCAYRLRDDPNGWFGNGGFRLVLSPVLPSDL